MIGTMAKKHSKTTDRHKQPRESFHLPQAMQDALQAFVDSRTDEEFGIDKSKVCRRALMEFLTKRGFWPWPRKPAGL